jgi:hypothetical protein
MSWILNYPTPRRASLQCPDDGNEVPRTLLLYETGIIHHALQCYVNPNELPTLPELHGTPQTNILVHEKYNVCYAVLTIASLCLHVYLHSCNRPCVTSEPNTVPQASSCLPGIIEPKNKGREPPVTFTMHFRQPTAWYTLQTAKRVKATSGERKRLKNLLTRSLATSNLSHRSTLRYKMQLTYQTEIWVGSLYEFPPTRMVTAFMCIRKEH